MGQFVYGEESSTLSLLTTKAHFRQHCAMLTLELLRFVHCISGGLESW